MNFDSRGSLWTGRVVSGLLAVFFVFVGMVNVVQVKPAVEGLVRYGYPAGVAPWIGLACVTGAVLYAIPQTAPLGAILLTGYLGGATATHVRVGEPFFLPVIIGVLVWGGLFLPDGRVRRMIPVRKLP